VTNKKVNDDEIVAISQEIKSYLMEHPNAVDSLEGITKWWLTRQRYEEAITKVKKSLDKLVADGDISKRFIADGKIVYAKFENYNNNYNDQID